MTYGGVVFANNLDSTTTTQSTLTKQTQAHRMGPQDDMKAMATDSEQMQTILAALVTDGTLTQTDVDNITAFMVTQETERKAEQAKVALMTETERQAYHNQKATTSTQPKPDRFSEMVTSGIITQEQADSITAKIEAQRLATRQAEQKTQLDTLVANNTITVAQVDQILAYEVTEDAARKAEMDKVKAMTTDERAAYLETSQSTPKDPLAGLVDAGILTQDQADAVTKLMGAGKHGGPLAGPMENDSEQMQTMLAAFVTDGTLTQTNADNITAFMSTQATERKAEQAKVALMTEAERQAYHDQKATTTTQPKLDRFSEMITSGIITQEQADTMTAKIEAQRLATRQAEQKTQLDALVANNTITAAQVDQILAYEVTEDAARKTEMDKVKAMTTDERAAYLETSQGTPKDPLAALVDAGILTQDQADAVTKVMGHGQRK
ncbi:MAG TPA: hypothetical protein VN456_14620 [Desulfosporosinus sp.]|nr:hypothetical protein [Desulfosporosinus sp.]